VQTLRRKPHRQAALRALGTAPLLALVIALGTPAVAPAQPTASVLNVSFQQGNPFFNIVVAIPTVIDTAARAGTADWGLRVTLTYLDQNGQVDTLDSGRLSIKNDTMFLATIDSNTVAITFELPLTVAPGPNPQYSATAQLLPPPQVPFASFSAKVDIVRNAQAFDVNTTCTLGAGSSIAPLTQDVTFQLGSFSTTIPAGSFTQGPHGKFLFDGVINNVALAVNITPLGGGSYAFRIDGVGAPNLPTSNPVMVTLTIGNNSGSATVTATII
jgi:hypothetical protein